MASDNEPESVKRFREYLRIKSVQPKPDYESCVVFLNKQAEELGLPIKVYECVKGKPIVIITWEGKQPELPTVVLNSHMDVVPVFPEEWEYDPFSAERVPIDNGDYKIIARGSQDMKICGSCYLEAVRKLKAQGVKLERTIHIAFVPDEEIGSVDGLEKFVKTEDYAKLNVGFFLDEGIANPGDDLRVFYGERATWWVEFTAIGNAGHGSQFIENTVGEKIVPFMNRMLDIRKEQQDLLNTPKSDGTKRTLGDVTTINLTMLNAGVQANVVPKKASVVFDIRVTPHISLNEFRTKIESLAAEHGLEVNFKQYNDQACVTSTDETNPFWVPFENVLKSFNIGIFKEVFPAGSDSRFIRSQGIPCLGISPLRNLPVLLHDHNEYVRESDFIEGIKLYTSLIPALANAGTK
ncbi:adenylate cyclase [Mycoemilia scoparia]|uniref:Adenylate cyclase n=1 Tax=Mycoemilia scoparia TaxID=417184 RepID=A0A9W7ZTU7_9FUNG|nr:adenylate cyclase [Mycoemilia scoparia]